MSTKKMIVIICLLLGFAWGLHCLWDNRDGPCIITQPRGKLLGGLVYSSKGIFNYGPIKYALYYPGKYKYSDKECETYYNVTEAEYSRRMYGQ